MSDTPDDPRVTVLVAAAVTGVPARTISRWVQLGVDGLTVWDGDRGQALVLASEVVTVRGVMATRQRESRFKRNGVAGVAHVR